MRISLTDVNRVSWVPSESRELSIFSQVIHPISEKESLEELSINSTNNISKSHHYGVWKCTIIMIILVDFFWFTSCICFSRSFCQISSDDLNDFKILKRELRIWHLRSGLFSYGDWEMFKKTEKLFI